MLGVPQSTTRDEWDLSYSIFDAVLQGVLYGEITRNLHLMHSSLTIVRNSERKGATCRVTG